MISGFDHVALLVKDLASAEAGYAALLGRPANWRGGMHGVSHVWFQLGNCALDIIAPTGEGAMGDQARARLDSHGEGIWAMSLATPDMAAAQKRLERLGVASYARNEVSVNGEASRSWTSAALRNKSVHGINLMLVETAQEPWPVSAASVDEAAAVSGIDHVVVRTPDPERAAALYGARLGLDMRLDRSNPDWGSRLMFFRCGDMVVEVAHDLKAGVGDGPDEIWGVSWRTPDVAAAQARMAAAGIDVSEVRTGRKPGTRVFTVRSAPAGVPTLVIGPDA